MLYSLCLPHVITRLTVNAIKIVGVILDDRLNWKDHIVYIKSKVCKSIGVLCIVKDVLDYSLVHMLYNSPYFGHCTEVWGNTYHSNTKPLFLLQKKSIKDYQQDRLPNTPVVYL